MFFVIHIPDLFLIITILCKILLFGEDDAETVEPEAAEEAPAEDAAE